MTLVLQYARWLLILSVYCPHMGKNLAEKYLTEFESLQEFLTASPQ